MTLYTVVITPDGDSTPSGPTGQATIVVDTAAPAPRITEMTVRTSDPRGLTPVGLSGMDLEAVVRVLASAMGIGTDRPAAGARLADAGVVDVAAADADAGAAAAPPAAASRRRATSKTIGAAPAADGGPGKSARSRSAADGGSGKTTGADSATSERQYRRMPDRAELLGVYEQLGGVTALARHYGVPRHTAQGWMSRARKKSS